MQLSVVCGGFKTAFSCFTGVWGLVDLELLILDERHVSQSCKSNLELVLHPDFILSRAIDVRRKLFILPTLLSRHVAREPSIGTFNKNSKQGIECIAIREV